VSEILCSAEFASAGAKPGAGSLLDQGQIRNHWAQTHHPLPLRTLSESVGQSLNPGAQWGGIGLCRCRPQQ
jgi:hypothetical protein